MDERDQRHLEAARDSANLAREHAASGGPNWKESMLVVDATWKRVEEVGEQLRQVSPTQQAALPQIPWRTIVQTRNRIAHNYGRVDIEILDGIVQSDLPDLIGEIDTALANG